MYNRKTIDFRPTTGWSIVHLTDTGCYKVEMPGWLIQEDPDGERHVVAADVDDDGAVRPILLDRWNVSAWYVHGPGQPDATRDEIVAKLAERKLEREKAMSR